MCHQRTALTSHFQRRSSSPVRMGLWFFDMPIWVRDSCSRFFLLWEPRLQIFALIDFASSNLHKVWKNTLGISGVWNTSIITDCMGHICETICFYDSVLDLSLALYGSPLAWRTGKTFLPLPFPFPLTFCIAKPGLLVLAPFLRKHQSISNINYISLTKMSCFANDINECKVSWSTVRLWDLHLHPQALHVHPAKRNRFHGTPLRCEPMHMPSTSSTSTMTTEGPASNTVPEDAEVVTRSMLLWVKSQFVGTRNSSMPCISFLRVAPWRSAHALAFSTIVLKFHGL